MLRSIRLATGDDDDGARSHFPNVTAQDIRFAVDTGGAKSGVAWINVHTAGTTMTVRILTATGPESAGTAAFWTVAGSVAGLAAVGAANFALTNLGDVIRWDVSTITGSFTFSVVVYLFDT